MTSILELHQLIKTKQRSALDITQEYLQRIENLEPKLIDIKGSPQYTTKESKFVGTLMKL